MRLELFPTIVHQEKLSNHAESSGPCLLYLQEVFDRCEREGISHPLEAGAGLSTFPVERALFRQPVFALICEEIIDRVARVTSFKAEFIEMWANRHRRDGLTLEHLHGAQICGAYYLSYPPSGGRLIFKSPLEYAVCGCPQVDVINFTKPDNSLHYMSIEPGDLIIFPGWLKHLTEPSGSDQDRIVVSFNMRIVGLVQPLMGLTPHRNGRSASSSS